MEKKEGRLAQRNEGKYERTRTNENENGKIDGPAIGARFSKASETFRARKAIFSSPVSKMEECIRLKRLV